MKKILVVLDHAEESASVQAYAIDLAQKFKVALSAIAVLDLPWLTAAQPEPLGGAGFKIKHDERMIRETRKQLDVLAQNFENHAKAAKINYSVIYAEGFPSIEIEKAALTHDLMIIGRKTDLHFQVEDATDFLMRTIAQDNPRPIISIEDKAQVDGNVLIAYDDSIQASKALHMFLLLGLGSGRKADILVMNESKKAATLIAERAKNMCELYGMSVETHLVLSEHSPEDMILKHSSDMKSSMIIMGAFGKNLLQKLIFGSCTQAVIKKSKIPVFIHH